MMNNLWSDKGNMGDIVITSRIRLARNYADLPFPGTMNDDQGFEVLDRCTKALKNCDFDFKYNEIRLMDELHINSMIERHVLSPALATNKHTGGVLLTDDGYRSIMINEEDHLRIQNFMPGLRLDEAYMSAKTIDDILFEGNEPAYDVRLGYLTTCPTNVGTGIRVSVMMHLPALTMGGQMKKLIESVSRLGMTVRGIYGEGSKALGNLYQISNQVTLGLSEEEIINAVKGIVNQVAQKEQSLRNAFMDNKGIEFQDRLLRSFGILKYAKKISSAEFMRLLSNVMLGVNIGIIKDVEQSTLNTLLISCQSATLQTLTEEDTSNMQKRDVIRAKYIQSILGNAV